MKKFLKDAAVYAGIGLLGVVGMKKGNEMQAKIDADTKAKTAQVLTETPGSTDHIYDLSQHYEQGEEEQDGVDEKIEGGEEKGRAEIQQLGKEVEKNPEFQKFVKDNFEQIVQQSNNLAKEQGHQEVVMAGVGKGPSFQDVMTWLGIATIVAGFGLGALRNNHKKNGDPDAANQIQEYMDKLSHLTRYTVPVTMASSVEHWDQISSYLTLHNGLILALFANLKTQLGYQDAANFLKVSDDAIIKTTRAFGAMLMFGLIVNMNHTKKTPDATITNTEIREKMKKENPKLYAKIRAKEQADSTTQYKKNFAEQLEKNDPEAYKIYIEEEKQDSLSKAGKQNTSQSSPPASTTQTETKPEPETKPKPEAKPDPKLTPPKKTTPAPKEDDIPVIPAGKNTGATGTTPKSN